jgi:hypothetical protein
MAYQDLETTTIKASQRCRNRTIFFALPCELHQRILFEAYGISISRFRHGIDRNKFGPSFYRRELLYRWVGKMKKVDSGIFEDIQYVNQRWKALLKKEKRNEKTSIHDFEVYEF